MALGRQRKCEDRIQSTWPSFHAKRAQRLEQGRRFGTAAEKITIALLEDLFTEVLDWSPADLNHEIDYADLIITQNGIKTLIVEAKRQGSLAWHQQAVTQGLGASQTVCRRPTCPAMRSQTAWCATQPTSTREPFGIACSSA